MFIYHDPTNECNEDELFETMEKGLPNNVISMHLWDGIKREIQPNYLVLIDNSNIIINRNMLSELFPNIPIISFTQNVKFFDDDIIHYTDIPTLVSLLTKHL